MRIAQRDQFVTIRSAQTLTEPHESYSRDFEKACKHADLQEMGEWEEGLKIRRAFVEQIVEQLWNRIRRNRVENRVTANPYSKRL